LVVIKKGVGYLITKNQSLKIGNANSKIQIPEFCPLWREILGKTPETHPKNPPVYIFSENIHSDNTPFQNTTPSRCRIA
jgi:hypothetical protein